MSFTALFWDDRECCPPLYSGDAYMFVAASVVAIVISTIVATTVACRGVPSVSLTSSWQQYFHV